MSDCRCEGITRTTTNDGEAQMPAWKQHAEHCPMWMQGRIEQLENREITDKQVTAGIMYIQRNIWGPNVSFEDMRGLLRAALQEGKKND